ncbi:MAG: hypothetical protein CL557_17855 [Alphaproteobacteria bacterium]|nr:hypothetical protein [Alphaproteobacteria bacterium]
MLVVVAVLKITAQVVTMAVQVLILYLLQLHPQVVVTEPLKMVVVDLEDPVVEVVLTREVEHLEQVTRDIQELLVMHLVLVIIAAVAAVVLVKLEIMMV